MMEARPRRRRRSPGKGSIARRPTGAATARAGSPSGPRHPVSADGGTGHGRGRGDGPGAPDDGHARRGQTFHAFAPRVGQQRSAAARPAMDNAGHARRDHLLPHVHARIEIGRAVTLAVGQKGCHRSAKYTGVHGASLFDGNGGPRGPGNQGCKGASAHASSITGRCATLHSTEAVARVRCPGVPGAGPIAVPESRAFGPCQQDRRRHGRFFRRVAHRRMGGSRCAGHADVLKQS